MLSEEMRKQYELALSQNNPTTPDSTTPAPKDSTDLYGVKLDPSWTPQAPEAKKNIFQKYTEGRKNLVSGVGDVYKSTIGGVISEGVAGAMNLTGLTDLITGKPLWSSLKGQITGGKQRDIIESVAQDTGDFLAEGTVTGAEMALGAVAGQAGAAATALGATPKVAQAMQIAGKVYGAGKNVFDIGMGFNNLSEASKTGDTAGQIASSLGIILDVAGITAEGYDIFKPAPNVKNAGLKRGSTNLNKAIGTPTIVKDPETNLKYVQENVRNAQDMLIKYTNPDYIPTSAGDEAIKQAVIDFKDAAIKRDPTAMSKLATIFKKNISKIETEDIPNYLSANRFKSFTQKDFDSMLQEAVKEYGASNTLTQKQLLEKLKTQVSAIKVGKKGLTPKQLWDISQRAYETGGDATSNALTNNLNKVIKSKLYQEVDGLADTAAELFKIGASYKMIKNSKVGAAFLAESSNTSPFLMANFKNVSKTLNQFFDFFSGKPATKALKKGVQETLKSQQGMTTSQLLRATSQGGMDVVK